MDQDFHLELTTTQIRNWLQGEIEPDATITGAFDELQGAALTGETGKATLLITCKKDAEI